MIPDNFRSACLLVLLLSAPACLLHGELRLLEIGPAFHPEDVRKSDAEVRLIGTGTKPALRIETGTSAAWPGVTLTAPGGRWDLSEFAYVELLARNAGTERVTVECRVDNPGADGTRHGVTGRVVLEPGAAGELRVPLQRSGPDTLDGKLFGLRGYPVAANGDHTINPANVTQVVVFLNKPGARHDIEISDLRAAGTWTAPTAWTSDATPYFPLIDTFGQYRHKDWPGKVHSVEELHALGNAEAKQLEEGAGPMAWNTYGGWSAGPKLEAGGFFRTEKYRGKWWLVDPDGNLFWSHGIDCVRMLDSTVVAEREDWFEDFPGDEADFAEFIQAHGRTLKGHYAGRTVRAFSFAGANLKRKYGEDWKPLVPTVIHRRLRHWGLNTVGNWSDDGVRLLRRTPYTDTIGSSGAPDIEGSEGYWGKFPDVFDPAFEAALRTSMAGRAKLSAKDPWCIGYFSDNEMSWGDEVSLALAALRSPPEQAAKRVFVEDLRAKYGEVSGLNRIWGTAHDSWGALLASREGPDPGKARGDLVSFYTRTAEKYFGTVREAIRAFAPHQLYLGCRFAAVNERAARAAAKYCDVVSYNLYHRTVADFVFPGGDRPLLIGEFHFGALDRGMFHPGLVPVENQKARGQAYREYVEGALRHPQFVGCHWFQYQDEPTTGRVYDEENYQIGFVDIADTPYAETIAASRQVGEKLYETRLGE